MLVHGCIETFDQHEYNPQGYISVNSLQANDK